MNSPILPANAQPHAQAGELCLANGRIITAERVFTGAVTLCDGHIVDVSEGSRVPAGALDLEGDFLIPGLVEVHTDNLERHIEPRPKVHLPHRPAILAHDGELASCGITTVFDALRIGMRSHETPYARQVASELLELRGEDALRVRHMLHLRAEICSETLPEELDAFDESDRVRLVSLMDHTPGQRQFRDVEKLKVYYVGKRGFTVTEFQTFCTAQAALRDRVGDLHEQTTVAAAARLGATLASHDDTTAEHVAHSAAMGIHLAEFPTTVEAAEACHAADIRIIMGAPNIMRGGSHSGNVSALDLAERSLLDIVSSDYVPSALIQSAFRLAALWDDLPRAIATVTRNPADATGLKDRGRIETGALADVVRVRPLRDTPVIRGVWRDGRQVG